jgi:hypothetical protein
MWSCGCGGTEGIGLAGWGGVAVRGEWGFWEAGIVK